MLQLSQTLAERYRQEGWWRDETVTDYLDRWAEERPDQAAIVSHFHAGDSIYTLTYRQLRRLVDRTAWALLDLGVEPGDRVALQLPNWWHFPVFALACARVGAVVVNIAPIMRHREMRQILGRSEARVLVIPRQFRGFDYAGMAAELAGELPHLRAVVVVGGDAPDGMRSFEAEILARPREAERPAGELLRLRPDPFRQLAQIGFTSGTTGEPKGVMHIPPTLMHAVRGMVSVLGLDSGDVILMASTLGHQTAFLYGFYLPVMLGTKVVYMDVWDAGKGLRLVAEEGVTFSMGAVPFLMDFVRAEAASRFDLGSWRYFVCAGAPIPPSLVEQAHRRLPCRVISAWGMTENGAVTMVRPEDPPERAAQSDGAPIPGMEVRVVDPETRRPLPPGREGLLVARGPAQFVGYYGRPDLWAASHDAEGWFDTGDLARMSEDGYIRIAGRLKDIIIRGGENIPVTEVEDILLRHPKVLEVAVVGVPDPRLGERACACVVLRPGEQLTLEEVQDWFARQGVAKQYWPELIEVLDQLPKTPSGKVQKYLLREWAKASRTTA